jgi:ribulose-phosphate 3-epimerase
VPPLMPRPLRVSPSILAADFARLGEEVRAVEAAGADLIHVDVMDGQFVPNLTLGPDIVKALRKSTKVPLDLHLMIVDPDRFVEEFAKAGADLINVHVEAVPDLAKTVAHIRSLGKKAAVAVKPATPLDVVLPVLADLDMVLLMTVNPGFSGQKFIEGVVPKIQALRAEIERRQLDIDIQVDGGINPTTVAKVVTAGANVLVAGYGIYRAPNGDYAAAIKALRTAAGVG